MTKSVRVVVLSVAAVVLIAILLFVLRGRDMATAEPSFSGSSADLRMTDVVLTLDAEIHEGRNAIWCASFLSAWKTLETDIAQEPITTEDSSDVVRSLGDAADPRPHIPEDALYTAAGWNDEGIIEQITADLARRFPEKEPPSFPDILPDSFVAYAYLEANVPFRLPYLQNDKPLVFTDSTGKTTELRSFGIRGKDAGGFYELRGQPAVLYADDYPLGRPDEFAIDLDRTSSPHQIVLALTEQKSTLAETYEYVEKKIRSSIKEVGSRGLDINDSLLVPDIFCRIDHRFDELEGQRFTNEVLRGQGIGIAQQDIMFRLDRSGAKLRSEAKSYALESMPIHYVFDQPFLVYMKKRDAETP